jgi:hypothetical protein
LCLDGDPQSDGFALLRWRISIHSDPLQHGLLYGWGTLCHPMPGLDDNLWQLLLGMLGLGGLRTFEKINGVASK